MPGGFERLNERQRRPNSRIAFIKPLEGPDKATAEDFLERVAAICVPVMKANYLYVVTLEEYEPNREFVGRNFNAGEIIQLVLKSPKTGRWLPFRYVQMVMMHELAHCKQMNHSRAFWAVRNQYATELKGLWSKSYVGEGLWGRGQSLYSGQYTADGLPDDEDLPEHLCGGTFRSQKRKRRRGQASASSDLSYAERKQRRIEKKFGANGASLGGDENSRAALEGFRFNASNPRVAKSKRGRDLRANAAILRMEREKNEQLAGEVEDDSDDSYDDDTYSGLNPEDYACDGHGHTIMDEKGNPMVRIADDDDDAGKEDQNQEELQELCDMGFTPKDKTVRGSSCKDTALATRNLKNFLSEPQPVKHENVSADAVLRLDDDDPASKGTKDQRSAAQVHHKVPELDEADISTASEDESCVVGLLPSITTKQESRSTACSLEQIQSADSDRSGQSDKPRADTEQIITPKLVLRGSAQAGRTLACPCCSVENQKSDILCGVCGNVLKPSMLHDVWCCKSDDCSRSTYINPGDQGSCGICGASKALSL